MLVLIVEKAPPALRGELTRWLLEPKASVFVGSLSAMVRQRLWEKVCQSCPEGGALLVHQAQTEQGYRVLTHGDTTREVVDYEGLQLVYWPTARKHKRR